MDRTRYNSLNRNGKTRSRDSASASLSNLSHPTTKDSTRSSYPSTNYSNPSVPRDLYTPSASYGTTPRESSYTPKYPTPSSDNHTYTKPSSFSGYSTPTTKPYFSNYPTSSSNNHHYPSSLTEYSTPVKSSPPEPSSHTNGQSNTTYTTIPIHSNGTNGLHTSR